MRSQDCPVCDQVRFAILRFTARAYGAIRGGPPVHPIDRQLGIETSQRTSRKLIRTGTDADAVSVGYVGATPSIIRKCLDVITIPPDAVFIDIGCGKGRVLVVATEYPFQAIIGIELSDFLCDLARRNIAKLPKSAAAERVAIVQGDATAPVLADAPCVVLFLYNPFHRPMVMKLVQHLEQEIAKNPDRVVWVVYYNPVCFDVFDASPSLRRYFAAKLDFEADEKASAPTGNTFDSVIIYQSVTGSQRPALPGADAGVKIVIPDLGADVIGPTIPKGGASHPGPSHVDNGAPVHLFTLLAARNGR
jgi:SAM-dependent methyltransferase